MTCWPCRNETNAKQHCLIAPPLQREGNLCMSCSLWAESIFGSCTWCWWKRVLKTFQLSYGNKWFGYNSRNASDLKDRPLFLAGHCLKYPEDTARGRGKAYLLMFLSYFSVVWAESAGFLQFFPEILFLVCWGRMQHVSSPSSDPSSPNKGSSTLGLIVCGRLSENSDVSS